MRKKIFTVLLIAVLFVTVFSLADISTQQVQAQTFQKIPDINGVVTATLLNVRKGPSTKHKIIAVLKKGKWVNVLAKIGKDWYAIYDPVADIVGCVHKNYLKLSSELKKGAKSGLTKAPKATATPLPKKKESTVLSLDEQRLLDLINKERAKAGLRGLKPDPKLMEVARLKAKDMVKNNYFSHQSPTYGSPFDMMREFGITFRTAGENIAGNRTEEGAVKAWMASEGHRRNILNGNFNYTGIGIYNSPKYGKILVQQFIGK